MWYSMDHYIASLQRKWKHSRAKFFDAMLEEKWKIAWATKQANHHKKIAACNPSICVYVYVHRTHVCHFEQTRTAAL